MSPDILTVAMNNILQGLLLRRKKLLHRIGGQLDLILLGRKMRIQDKFLAQENGQVRHFCPFLLCLTDVIFGLVVEIHRKISRQALLYQQESKYML